MREIIFRGMDITGNIWYYGMLSIPNSRLNGFHVQAGHSYISNKSGSPFAYEVRPETVGQYTGLKDKNGTMIFEGDIVEVVGTKRVGKYTTNVVFKNSCFMLEENKTYLVDNMALYGVTVIGNIYENKEEL